jgi:branched-chain amino acid transport system substrate-binding protein
MTTRSTITRHDLFTGALAATATIAAAQLAFSSETTIYYGVAAPLSGDNAGYGAVWKKGMNLAVDEINAAGGIKGRKIALIFEDTQSDPKQAIPVAQLFVDDPRVIAELGDFSSPASEAASPIYERAKLVQFGFNNSDPKFTLGGSYMFSTTSTVVNDASKIADYIFKHLGKRAAVLYQNTQWGDAGRVEFAKRFTDLGGQVVSAENYLATDTDFRAILSKTRNANPNGLALFSYYTDGALLLQQAQDVGLHVRAVSSGSNFSNEFVKLGGAAVEGTVLTVLFFADDPRPDIRRFVSAYTKAYGEKPDAFAATSYDAVKIAAWATEHGGADRDGFYRAFLSGTAIPSLIHGPFAFGPDRRPVRQDETWITIKDGKFISLH